MALRNTLPCMTLIIGPLTKLGLLFPVVCFVLVFDQTLVGHPYHDNGVYILKVWWNTVWFPEYSFRGFSFCQILRPPRSIALFSWLFFDLSVPTTTQWISWRKNMDWKSRTPDIVFHNLTVEQTMAPVSLCYMHVFFRLYESWSIQIK